MPVLYLTPHTTQIWDIATRSIHHTFEGHQEGVYSIDFSSSGHIIVSGSGDQTARIWSMLDGSSTVLNMKDPDSLDNDGTVASVAISPDGRWVAVGNVDSAVRIWNMGTGKLVERLRGHRDCVYSVAFTPDGKGLVSGSLDGTLKYWDVGRLGRGGGGGASADGVVKGKEGVGTAAAAAARVAGALFGGVSRKEDKASQCTMNFTGHKVYYNYLPFPLPN